MVKTLYSEQLGAGPELVMLHGWGMSSAVWVPLVPDLSQYFHLTLVDLPGHGRSAGYSPDTLPEIVDALSRVTPDKASWLGWSLGGMLATAFAARFPRRINALVLVASTPRFVAGNGWPAAMPVEVFTRFVDSFAVDATSALKRFVALQFAGSDASRGSIRQLQSEVVNLGSPKSALLNGLSLLGSLDLREEYAGLKCPILSILGECDRLVPFGVGCDMQAINARTQLEILPQAGHLPFMTHSQQFLASLESFLNG